MYLIVVGGGRVGQSIIEVAMQDGHEVALIEENQQRAQQAAERHDILVLHANVGEEKILEEAEAKRADAMIATTGDDSANLMAMFIARELGIPTLVSVVNEKSHRRLFERLGVHILVDPEDIVARYLYDFVLHPKLDRVMNLPDGAQIIRLKVQEKAPVAGKTLEESKQKKLLPANLLVLSITRGEDTLIPNGQTSLERDDHLTVFCPAHLKEKDLKAFTG